MLINQLIECSEDFWYLCSPFFTNTASVGPTSNDHQCLMYRTGMTGWYDRDGMTEAEYLFLNCSSMLRIEQN